MNYLGIDLSIRNLPVLDQDFIPMGPWMIEYEKEATRPVGIAIEREEGKVTFHAVRGGDTPSSHTVFFFGEGERLEITHHCLNWKGCAKGAVNACIWMASQPVGLYGIRESMGL